MFALIRGGGGGGGGEGAVALRLERGTLSREKLGSNTLAAVSKLRSLHVATVHSAA